MGKVFATRHEDLNLGFQIPLKARCRSRYLEPRGPVVRWDTEARRVLAS